MICRVIQDIGEQMIESKGVKSNVVARSIYKMKNRQQKKMLVRVVCYIEEQSIRDLVVIIVQKSQMSMRVYIEDRGQDR